MKFRMFVRTLCAGLTLGAILHGQPQAQTTIDVDKVSGQVRERAARGETLHLLIALTGQAQRGSVEAIKARYRDRIQYQDQQSKQFAGEKERQAAVVERDKLRVIERRELGASRAAEFEDQQHRLIRLADQLGGRVVRRFRITNSLLLEVPASALATLEADPGVARIQWNDHVQLHLGVSGQILGAPAFWDGGYRGGTQVVAVIDSGVAEHPGFDGLPVKLVTVLDSAMNSSCLDRSKPLDTGDADGHGTHVAGIVAAQSVAGVPGATGVAPGIGQLIVVRVGAPGKGGRDCPDSIITKADVIGAIEYVVEETPATVVNLSLGSDTRLDDDLDNWVIDEAVDSFDVAFVMAAGNAGRNTGPQLSDLALSYNGIAVANVDTKGTRTRSDDSIHITSSRGPSPSGRRKPDLAAPGTDIVSLALGGKAKAETGTSMAAPHVTGAVALMLDAGVAGPREAKALLLNTADRAGWARDWGWGGAHLENAWQQRKFIESGTIGAGTSRFYRFTVDKSAKATLVWNRHIAGVSPDGKTFFGDFRDLNLHAYEETSNRLVSSSTSRIDNVEQIALTGEGSALLKVTHLATERWQEPFALAFSNGSFEEVRPGQLSLRCAAPNGVTATVTYRVSCTLSNEGSLPVFGLTFRLLVPVGFRSTAVAPVERIRPGQQLTFNFDTSAPATAQGQTAEYSVRVEGTAYGENQNVTAQLLTTFGEVKAQDCTLVTTPASGSLLLQSGSQNFVLKVEFPRYDPQQPGTCTWSISDVESWVSFPSTRTGTGNGQVVVGVAAAPTNTRLTTRVGDLRIVVNGRLFPWTFQQLYRK